MATLLSLFAAYFVILFFMYGYFSIIMGAQVTYKEYTGLLLTYALLLIDISAALYNFWYQNFYTFENIGNNVAALVLISAAIFYGSFLLLLKNSDKSIKIFAILSTGISIITGLVGLLSNRLKPVAEAVRVLPASSFFAVLAIVALGLLALIARFSRMPIEGYKAMKMGNNQNARG